MLTVTPGAIALPLSEQTYRVRLTATDELAWEWVATWETRGAHLDLKLRICAGDSMVEQLWVCGSRERDLPRAVSGEAWPRETLETVLGKVTSLDVLSVALLISAWEAEATVLVDEAKALGLAWQHNPRWRGEAEEELRTRWMKWGGFTW